MNNFIISTKTIPLYQERCVVMEIKQFDDLMQTYTIASVDEKIDIFCSTENLTQEQYMQLLRSFPRAQIKKLERALA